MNTGWVTAAVTAAAVLLHFVPAAARALEWSRDAALGGQVWRWLTGHVVHFGLEHLLWNAGTFAALAWLVERRSRTAMLLCTAIGAVVVTAGIAAVAPEVGVYRGLSGIDCALFTWLAIRLLRDEGLRSPPGLVALGALALLTFKLAFETLTGGTLFVDAAKESFSPIPIAHVLGGAVGAVVSLWRVRPTGHAQASPLSDYS